jgi:hypothetical protein
MIGVAQMLAAQEDHLVPVERVGQLGEGFVGQGARLHPDDLRAHRSRERSGLDMAVGAGMVVKPARRGDPDFLNGAAHALH